MYLSWKIVRFHWLEPVFFIIIYLVCNGKMIRTTGLNDTKQKNNENKWFITI